MNIKIEFRYSVLTALLLLLWLLIEYVAGLQDNYIAFHPYVSLLAYAIPVFTFRLALLDKMEQKSGGLTYGQAFLCGFIMTIFFCALTVPVQLVFHKYINPDFFSNMILYTVKNSKQSPEQAALFFNLKSYIAESVVANFVMGIIISAVLTFKMRTVN